MLKVSVERIATGFEESWNHCYVHARAGIAPDGRMLMTTQKLLLSGSDVFSGLEMSQRPSPTGAWSPITVCPELSRRPAPNGMEMVFCDATPTFHKATGRFLLTGHAAIYDHNAVFRGLKHRAPLWSVFDETAGKWMPYRELAMPEGFDDCGSGCAQILELPDGTLLIPGSTKAIDGKPATQSSYSGCFVMHCSFDGNELKLLDLGNIQSIETGRGLGEPSIACSAGRYFLCLRNDDTSFIATSLDGLHFSKPQEWLFDDGTPLGSYNTQQHWLVGKEKLYLVYTRRAEFNNHIFRHRAPLFIAEIDTENLRVIRETEQVTVPMRGARLGNFGCFQNSPDDGYIMAAEWMQTTPPNPHDYRRCIRYGSDNSIFIAHVEGL